MPVPEANSTILVSGASGYIASWICLYLLEQGYSIRGTTRNQQKGQWMKDMYRARGYDKFDFVIVSDLETEDAFDEAVIGVDAIIHTASPFHWNVEKPDDFIKPAVAGTVSVLRAASKEPKVQRVIITSSYASILENKDPGTVTFTEADWNQQSIDAVENEGVDAWRMHWYRASKTLAERAAWGFMKEKSPSFDLATICPPFVLGPIIHQADSAEKLNTSVATWYAYLTGEKTDDEAVAPAGILCDVRDVARTHIAALLLPEAGGERFGVATRTFTHQLLLDHIRSEPDLKQALPEATKGTEGAEVPPINWFDCSKSEKMLNLMPTNERETAIDMTRSLLDRKKTWSKAA